MASRSNNLTKIASVALAELNPYYNIPLPTQNSNRPHPSNDIKHDDTDEPPEAKIFHATRPSWHSLSKFKITMGAILALVGLVGVIFFISSPDNKSSQLATQIPPAGGSVGRVRGAPLSRVVGHIVPQLTIGICSIIAGAWLVLSMRIERLANKIQSEVQVYAGSLTYYQICFQGTAIILSVLPLCGVINVYELAFAVTLTWGEMLMYLASDIINGLSLRNWEIIDTAKQRVTGKPVDIYRNAMGLRKGVPWLSMEFKSLTSAIIIHTFTWSIIMIHLVEAMISDTYTIEPEFVGIVLITMLLQFVIPAIKLVQLTRPKFMTWCRYYKFVMLVIELVQFTNMVLITSVLVMSGD